MQQQVAFFASIAFSFAVWTIVTVRYIWPGLRSRARADALRPLLILHSFRFIGLAFIVPGVVSADLPAAFADAAAYGDVVAAALALLAWLFIARPGGIVLAWMFSILGSVDLVNAFYQAGRSGLVPGQFGAAYFLPTLIVPLLFITHALAVWILVQGKSRRLARPGGARPLEMA